MIEGAFVVIGYIVLCCLAGVLIHWREEATRPRRRQPERSIRTGTRHYDGGLWL